ncbi:MAG TPA: hypothetical protein VI336_02630 [Candidatus Saccharimonadales bacterium]|nr:hypothetical protein [Candidatus Saccharimonadales bacterium]
MARNTESGSGSERKGRLLRVYKKFNKISAAVLGAAGVILNSEILIGLALLDAGQAYLAGKLEKWRQRTKSAKPMGGLALQGAKT